MEPSKWFIKHKEPKWFLNEPHMCSCFNFFLTGIVNRGHACVEPLKQVSFAGSVWVTDYVCRSFKFIVDYLTMNTFSLAINLLEFEITGP